MCVRVQLYTHSNPSHLGAEVIRQTREDALTAAFCLLSTSHRNPFQQPMLFICLYYLLFLNIIKVIKTAPFGSFKLPQWRGLFIYFGVCLFFFYPPSFLSLNRCSEPCRSETLGQDGDAKGALWERLVSPRGCWQGRAVEQRPRVPALPGAARPPPCH